MANREQVVLNDRYELQRRVGRGGMAEVFLARDRLLDRPVAIKILFAEYARDQSFVTRFKREAQAAANLNHPNIVGVYDWGRERGTYYIVMEYVDGRTVSDIIRNDGPLSPKQAARVAADVASALGFAHAKGVVHRDVKPGNVILTRNGEVKVADFGLVKRLTEETDSKDPGPALTMTNMLLRLYGFHVEGMMLKGNVLTELNRLDEAGAVYQECLAMMPGDHPARDSVAQLTRYYRSQEP